MGFLVILHNFKILFFSVLIIFSNKIFSMADANSNSTGFLRASLDDQSANLNKIDNVNEEILDIKNSATYFLSSDGTRAVKVSENSPKNFLEENSYGSQLKRSKTMAQIITHKELEKLNILLEVSEQKGYKKGAQIIYQQAINAYGSEDYYIFVEILKFMSGDINPENIKSNNPKNKKNIKASIQKIKNITWDDINKTKLFLAVFYFAMTNLEASSYLEK